MTDTVQTEEAGWSSDKSATFGDRLAGAREAAGLSQEDFARRLGVRLTTVKGWEDDQMEPRANRLQMAAGMLSVSLRWLLTGEGDGIDVPTADVAMARSARDVLTELARMRAALLVLSGDVGRAEKSLRVMLRECAA